MTSLSLDKTKSIGQVIYIVEGDRTEHELIERIYSLLGYSVIAYNKFCRSCTCLQGRNKYSKVFVIPAAHSAIAKLSDDADYFDEVYRFLVIDYGLDVENSAIFYLFDRDRRSNRPRQIKPVLEKYGSSRSSVGYEMNGLFLLSYPSIEAYLSTANGDDLELGAGESAKRYVEGRNYCIGDVCEKEILLAASSMVSTIESICKTRFCAESLDDFTETNKRILSFQDDKWARDHRYATLSLLSASLIDLGIISVD